MSPRQIGLIANDGKPGARELVLNVVEALAGHGLTPSLDRRTAQLIGSHSTAAISGLSNTCDLLIVLGGDGTILQVVHELGEHRPPLLGINLGTLGFLTCVGAAAWREAVEAVAANTYQLSTRTLLEVEILRGGERVEHRIALNDAVLSRGELSRLIKLNVTVDGERLSEYNADGLIVSTPTGSTAYSLSAGGPVLTPDSGVFVVTPICPHVLTMRPVMVSDASTIEITAVPNQPEVFLTVDGQDSLRVAREDTIRITKAAQTLQLAILPGMSFFEVLRQKLKWSGSAI